ncbi:hypothetical protein ACFQ1Y_08475 [Virgibacillus alimentarius]
MPLALVFSEPEKINRSRRKSTGAGENQPEPEKINRSRRKSTGAGENQPEPEKINRSRRKYLNEKTANDGRLFITLFVSFVLLFQ